MWVTESGGFETLSLADPLDRFGVRLKQFLDDIDMKTLAQLSAAAGEASDRVFADLRNLNLPSDTENQYEWRQLPASITFDLPKEDDPTALMFDQLREIPLRWRLDAAMALEEGIDRVLAARRES